MPFQLFEAVTGAPIPDPQGTVRRAADGKAIICHCHAAYAAGMSLQYVQTLPRA